MTDCAELSVEVVPEGEHALARFVTPSEACTLCRGREGTFSRDNDGYEVFRPCARRDVRKNLDLFNAALDDSDAGIKGIGLEAVARLSEGPPSDELKAKLEHLMEDAAPSVRVAAAYSLYRLGQQ